MAHHPGILTAHDLYEKLRRELSRLEVEASTDTFFNLVLTAWHLCDWVKKDPSVPTSARAALADLRKDTSLQACRDLANGGKHYQLDYSDPIVADATCVTGFGIGRYGKGTFGQGEPSIQVTLADGRLVSGLELARKVTQLWTQFVDAHKI